MRTPGARLLRRWLLALRPPGRLGALTRPRRRSDLKHLSVVQLSRELSARLHAGERFPSERDLVLGAQLQADLEKALDVHENRFSARRHYDLLRPILAVLPRARFRGATIVDLGCGSLNPFSFSFLFLMLGARRAYALDLEPIQDLPGAVRALARCAAWFLVDSRRILDPDAVSPEEVLRNLAGFDLPKLAAGDASGIASDRLLFREASIVHSGLEAGEADCVFSTSLLEHVEEVDAALDSVCRITRPGGHGHHLIDFADHRVYHGKAASPFEFLKEKEGREGLCGDSNRLRIGQWRELFERHGFSVERVESARAVDLTAEEHAQFVEPYRSMAREELAVVCARFLVRRR